MGSSKDSVQLENNSKLSAKAYYNPLRMMWPFFLACWKSLVKSLYICEIGTYRAWTSKRDCQYSSTSKGISAGAFVNLPINPVIPREMAQLPLEKTYKLQP